MWQMYTILFHRILKGLPIRTTNPGYTGPDYNNVNVFSYTWLHTILYREKVKINKKHLFRKKRGKCEKYIEPIFCVQPLENFNGGGGLKTPFLTKLFFIFLSLLKKLILCLCSWFRTYIFWLFIRGEKKMSFCHKLKIIIPISVKPDVVDIWYFKL